MSATSKEAEVIFNQPHETPITITTKQHDKAVADYLTATFACMCRDCESMAREQVDEILIALGVVVKDDTGLETHRV